MQKAIPLLPVFRMENRVLSGLISIFLLLIVSSASAENAGEYVTFSGKNVPLKNVFTVLKKQTGYSFFYNEKHIADAKPITIDVKEMPLLEFLETIFTNQELEFNIRSKTIVVSKKKTAAILPAPVGNVIIQEIPPIDIRGRVVDESGKPVAASIQVKGSQQGTSTSNEGYFELKGVDKNAILRITAVNIVPKEIKLNGETELLITVQTATTEGEEVTINAGYYRTTNRLKTGNISKVNGDDIARQPVSNPILALAGRVPGMSVTQFSGMPGTSFQVQIRGQNSIQSGNEPLYVIDGVIFSVAPEIQSDNNLNPAGGNPLNLINPNDIQSIEVLKDADATAIYGSRGANGVVLITTRKGVAGDMRVNISAYTGFGKITRRVKYLNTQQYLEMRREAFANDGAVPDPAIDVDVLGGSTWDPNSYTDWQDKLIGGTAKYNDLQASVSGGNAQTQYIVGTGYHRETTVFPGDNSDQKASLHFGVNTTSRNQRFQTALRGTFLYNQSTLPSSDLTFLMTSLAPNAPKPYNEDGTLNWADNTWIAGNPYAITEQLYKATNVHSLANLNLSYLLTEGLTLRTSLGVTNIQSDQRITKPFNSINPLLGENSGLATFNTAHTLSWIAEPQIEYVKKTGAGKLSFLVGMSFQQSRNEAVKQTGRGFSSDQLLNNLQAASTIAVDNVTDIRYKYNGGYGRINYNLKERYLVNVTARRDGSSRFGPGRQFANFAAAGLGWIFTSEEWMKQFFPVLSYGKLRTSYGTSGNDQLADYTFLDRYMSTTYPYGGAQGLYPVSLYNDQLAWEVNRKWEAGLELGFWKDRLSFSASYYRNISTNQLLQSPLSAVTGFPFIAINLPAKVQNTGIELVLQSTVVRNKDFNWSTGINLTIPRNKLLAFPGLESSSFNETLVIGQPLSVQKLFTYAGVDPVTGLYQFRGSDGEITLDPIPLVDNNTLVDLAPRLYGGWQHTVTWKQFSVDLLLQFVQQKGFNFFYEGVGGLPGTFGANQPVSVLDRWQKPGDVAFIQRYNQDYSTLLSANYAFMSDQVVRTASFVRLKNLSLNYQVPQRILSALHLQSARLFFQGQNLLTFTDYKGYDPENRNYLSLPPLRVLTFGLNLTF